MSKSSFFFFFLEALLENNLPRDVINDNIDYYDNYIKDRIKEGDNEDEILGELGSGRIIAKNIHIV